MASMALDFTAIAHALLEFVKEIPSIEEWRPVNDDQAEFLVWYAANRWQLEQLTGLTAKASKDFRALNELLTEHGFKPQFDESMDGVGVVSILDMLVEWLVDCKTTTIMRYDSEGRQQAHPAFQVPADGTMIYDAEEYDHPLVHLRTKSGHGLWLMEMPEPKDDFDLVERARQMLTARTERSTRWTAGVTVPMLEIQLEPDLDWLLGMRAVHDGWFIAQAAQEFKLRANEKGARVKVATSLTMVRGMSYEPQPLVFRKPFIGCFTQPGHGDLPLAVFWADYDSWRGPEGTLEEL